MERDRFYVAHLEIEECSGARRITVGKAVELCEHPHVCETLHRLEFTADAGAQQHGKLFVDSRYWHERWTFRRELNCIDERVAVSSPESRISYRKTA
jgi:hypothetical protein